MNRLLLTSLLALGGATAAAAAPMASQTPAADSSYPICTKTITDNCRVVASVPTKYSSTSHHAMAAGTSKRPAHHAMKHSTRHGTTRHKTRHRAAATKPMAAATTTTRSPTTTRPAVAGTGTSRPMAATPMATKPMKNTNTASAMRPKTGATASSGTTAPRTPR